jgi:hypothetical protein
MPTSPVAQTVRTSENFKSDFTIPPAIIEWNNRTVGADGLDVFLQFGAQLSEPILMPVTRVAHESNAYST